MMVDDDVFLAAGGGGSPLIISDRTMVGPPLTPEMVRTVCP